MHFCITALVRRSLESSALAGLPKRSNGPASILKSCEILSSHSVTSAPRAINRHREFHLMARTMPLTKSKNLANYKIGWQLGAALLVPLRWRKSKASRTSSQVRCALRLRNTINVGGIMGKLPAVKAPREPVREKSRDSPRLLPPHRMGLLLRAAKRREIKARYRSGRDNASWCDPVKDIVKSRQITIKPLG